MRWCQQKLTTALVCVGIAGHLRPRHAQAHARGHTHPLSPVSDTGLPCPLLSRRSPQKLWVLGEGFPHPVALEYRESARKFQEESVL